MVVIKDSGERIQMAGMVRDTSADKIRYDLVFDGPMFKRWAEHLTAGAKKYSARNWTGAKSQEELDRFRESAVRHFVQWLAGETDEDHAAAVVFNINGVEYVKDQLKLTDEESEGPPFENCECAFCDTLRLQERRKLKVK